MNQDNQKKIRTIRSFVLREGRMTKGQQNALERLWPKYGIVISDSMIDINAVFERTAPVILEIGFGMGASLLAMAKAHPENNYLGIEVHRPGVGALLMEMEQHKVDNIRIICHDAVQVLEKHIESDSLDAVNIFFPDPWPKTRHHKRRIIQPAFITLLISKLNIGGRIHLATDWENYAEHMMQVLSTFPNLINIAGKNQFAPQPTERPTTKFEQRGKRLGHGVWDLIFIREM